MRYACSLGLLGWLAWRVDWSRFGGLRGLDWSLATPAVLLAGLAYPLQAWRWQVLLGIQDIVLPARWVHGAFWIGQFYNSFLPGGVAGDAVRLGHLWRVAPGRRAGAAASLLVDRLLGLSSLLVLATLALGAHGVYAREGERLRSLLGVSAVACLLIATVGWTVVRTRWWQPLSARVLGSERAAVLHDAAQAFGCHRGALVGCMALSVAAWLVDFCALWVLARAVGLAVGLPEMMVAVAAAYVAAALPISIGGHGVREGTLVAMLGMLGYGAGSATALFAVAFWASSVGWSLVGGGVYLLSILTGWPLGRGGQAERLAARKAG
ncbi:MAG: flippase-like domain-containing protein [Opitutaceae bacterium]|nr:flippase-like domain-containing protein [Opitutaceae bacterium]